MKTYYTLEELDDCVASEITDMIYKQGLRIDPKLSKINDEDSDGFTCTFKVSLSDPSRPSEITTLLTGETSNGNYIRVVKFNSPLTHFEDKRIFTKIGDNKYKEIRSCISQSSSTKHHFKVKSKDLKSKAKIIKCNPVDLGDAKLVVEKPTHNREDLNLDEVIDKLHSKLEEVKHETRKGDPAVDEDDSLIKLIRFIFG